MIEEVTLQGFKSYRRRQKVHFTQGVNKISGRNASGKTTLLEAVLFGLFGDVPGVNKQDLVTLGGGNLSVTVVFRSPLTGQRAKILREGSMVTRRRRGVKEEGFRSTEILLEVEGEDHTYTRDIDVLPKMNDLLGVGKSTFTNIVYAQQKEFIEILNPQRGRMDAILGLTTPAEIREQLREAGRMLEERGGIAERGTVEERIRLGEESLEMNTTRLVEVRAKRDELSEGLREKRGMLVTLQGRVEAMEELSEGFRQLEKLRGELETLSRLREQRVQDLQERYEELGEHPEERRAKLQASRRSSGATEERLEQLIDQELTGEMRGLDGEVARLRHQISEHGELAEQGLATCPKCGQEIDYELIERDLAAWREALEERSRRLGIVEREIEEISSQVRQARQRRIEAEKALDQLESLERQIGTLKSSVEELENRGRRLQAKLEVEREGVLQRAEKKLGTVFASLEDAELRVDDMLRGTQERLSALQQEVGRREGEIQSLEKREKEIQVEMERQEKALEESRLTLGKILEYEAKIAAVDRIRRLYGEYEQQLRENTLRELEYRTYGYFRRLTDQQIYSSCHIDRERYTLEVQPIGSNRTLPAWRTGGGHESLFALAERLALLRVMGFPHMLILDEPTDAVDSENVPQLLEYIAKSSREIGQVLLVTHHGHGEEEGVNLIRVRKVDGESRVYQEYNGE